MSQSGPLEYLLRLQAECGGAIPAARYVQEALYHPDFGYYTRHIRGVGRRGDFATSPTLGRALGQSIARWIASERPRRAPQWHVIEAGAGTGELAATILDHFGILGRIGLFYHIVETSSVLRDEQRTRLARRKVSWHEDMPSALAASGGCALIFSNELADAFPCRVLERNDARWFDVAVRIDAGRIHEVLVEPRPSSLAGFSALSLAFSDGQRIETHQTFREWLQTWTPFWKDGRLLTIDYGDQAGELYHRRPRGTLRAYYHHQRFEGLEVYRRFGRQDITADVNFTDLIAWGEQLGLKTESFETQAAFLARYAPRRIPFLPHDALLADHHGAGSAFKVLIQRRRSAASAGAADASQALQSNRPPPSNLDDLLEDRR